MLNSTGLSSQSDSGFVSFKSFHYIHFYFIVIVVIVVVFIVFSNKYLVILNTQYLVICWNRHMVPASPIRRVKLRRMLGSTTVYNLYSTYSINIRDKYTVTE